MSYNNHYMRLRVKSVQEFDRMYSEPENRAKCHKRAWERLGCYIFGLSYSTYLNYLKRDVSDIPSTPLEALKALRKLADRLLERDLQAQKRNIRGRKTAAAGKEPSEQH